MNLACPGSRNAATVAEAQWMKQWGNTWGKWCSEQKHHSRLWTPAFILSKMRRQWNICMKEIQLPDAWFTRLNVGSLNQCRAGFVRKGAEEPLLFGKLSQQSKHEDNWKGWCLGEGRGMLRGNVYIVRWCGIYGMPIATTEKVGL